MRMQKRDHGGDQRASLRLGGQRRRAHSSFSTRLSFFLLGSFFLALIAGLSIPPFVPGTASVPLSPRTGDSSWRFSIDKTLLGGEVREHRSIKFATGSIQFSVSPSRYEDPSTGLVWGVSIGEELTWAWPVERGPDGPGGGTVALVVPDGNLTKVQYVNWTEGDRFRYVITSFGTMHSTILGSLPAAYGNLTLNGVTGINDCLFHWVRPINLNWTQYALNRSAGPVGFPPVYRSEVVRDTEDIFEFKVIVNEEYKIPNPDRHGEEGDLYRYDKQRGILLHRENLEWARSGSVGYYWEVDFLGPPYSTTNKPGLVRFDIFLWIVGFLFLATLYQRTTRK